MTPTSWNTHVTDATPAELVVNRDDGAGWFGSLLGRQSRIALHSDQLLGRLSQIEVQVEPRERLRAMRPDPTSRPVGRAPGLSPRD